MAHVLLIDDEPRSREYLTKVVGRLGHEVVSAEPDEDTTSILKGQPCEVIIVRLSHPVGRVLNAIRALAQQGNTKILALCLNRFGDPDRPDRDTSVQRARKAGAMVTLRTPVAYQDLEKAIDSILRS